MKNALNIYRSLTKSEKVTFDPSGKKGAKEVRKLQALAKNLDTGNRARAFFEAGYKMPELARVAGQSPIKIPLSVADQEKALDAAQKLNPRRKNWKKSLPTLRNIPIGTTFDETIQYAGRFKGWSGYNYYPLMQSHARISADKSILCVIIGFNDDRKTYTIQSGRGYFWGVDASGLRLVRARDGADFHPNTDDIQQGRLHIIKILAENASRRKKIAADAKKDAALLKKAAKDGVWVCFSDSILAGNCKTGTTAFAQRHGLDLTRHYKASFLIGTDDTRRVSLAILAATRRQIKEQAAGFCHI